jgi:hypothetical protein
MKKMLLALLVSHAAIGVLGFALGIYMLPILIAPEAPTESQIEEIANDIQFTGEFRKDLQGSDGFHWGEGKVSIGSKAITLVGELAPGPDYKLYLSKEYLETEEEFSRLKASMVRVGDVKTFENFLVKVPHTIDPSQYNTVIIWCETFGEFITSAQYQ